MTERLIVSYPITAATQDMIIPTGSKILSVGEYFGKIVLFVLVDPEINTDKNLRVSIRVIPTGVTTDIDPHVFAFLGSVKIDSGVMYHVFYHDEGYYGVLPR